MHCLLSPVARLSTTDPYALERRRYPPSLLADALAVANLREGEHRVQYR